jgi:hypothetical protein
MSHIIDHLVVSSGLVSYSIKHDFLFAVRNCIMWSGILADRKPLRCANILTTVACEMFVCLIRSKYNGTTNMVCV